MKRPYHTCNHRPTLYNVLSAEIAAIGPPRAGTVIARDDIVKLPEFSWDYRAARTLHIANSVGVFDLLSHAPASAAEVAEHCRTKPDLTEKLLIACAAMGLLEKAGEKYKNTELAYTYLVRGRPLYQGDMIAHSATVWEFWDALYVDIRLEDAPKPEPDRHGDFIRAMHNIAIDGRAQAIADAIDLSKRSKLLDIGGGPGTYSIVFCRKHLQLKATVFDLPETIAIAREVVAKEGMQDRVSATEGDWNTDTFGEGYDAVLMSNVLHGPTSKARMKLTKAYDAMVSGGMLIIQDFVLNDGKTGPLAPALFNIMVGAYSRPELFEEVKKAGFTKPRVLLEMEEHGSMVVTASKP